MVTPRSKDYIIPAIIIGLFLMFMTRVYGHTAPSGWAYPYECCSDRDCKPIDAKLVHETSEGWDIAPSEGGGFVPRGKERQSPDGMYHLCRHEGSGLILCFFVPPMGS